mmetsp:Transcript_29392/g.89216  ORF Transcript_29392/g.89216 Transcript_29392/m.89216 type:complete len:231 (+) Transcript_29392:211-903(+)
MAEPARARALSLSNGIHDSGTIKTFPKPHELSWPSRDSQRHGTARLKCRPDERSGLPSSDAVATWRGVSTTTVLSHGRGKLAPLAICSAAPSWPPPRLSPPCPPRPPLRPPFAPRAGPPRIALLLLLRPPRGPPSPHPLPPLPPRPLPPPPPLRDRTRPVPPAPPPARQQPAPAAAPQSCSRHCSPLRGAAACARGPPPPPPPSPPSPPPPPSAPAPAQGRPGCSSSRGS